MDKKSILAKNYKIFLVEAFKKLNYSISFTEKINQSNKKTELKSNKIKFYLGGLLIAYLISEKNFKEVLYAKTIDSDNLIKNYGNFDKNYKTYTLNELKKHNCKENRIWVAFRQGVYDVTDFVDQHPGGEIILMAAGNHLESFWSIHENHKQKGVLDLLESYRIGNLEENKNFLDNKTNVSDLYLNEPIRNSLLSIHTMKPFNAETPSHLITENFLTPNEIFFVRNHLPVPKLNKENYRLKISGLGLEKSFEFTLEDLKNLPKHEIITTIQCAGNRRDEFNKFQEVKGLAWEKGAISSAKWTGVLLTDLLRHINFDFNNKELKHVQGEGYDLDASSKPYSISIQSELALDPKNEVLIAYKMNDEDIPRDHGYPVRLIVPGVVGARNIKWLSKLIFSKEEADSLWQRKDYKGFKSNINMNNVNFEEGYSIQQLPVQSAICQPKNLAEYSCTAIIKNKNKIKLTGYAWSGGGHKIIRVDISSNNGKNWKTANLFSENDYKKKLSLDNLLQNNKINLDNYEKEVKKLYNNKVIQDNYKSWSWVFWSIDFELNDKELKEGNFIEFICKATDSSYNTQPENSEFLWNFRGVLNNAWHRIKIKIC